MWGNLSFNPLSALTHATLVDICQYPPSRELAASLMREAEQVAARLGIRFRVTLEKRIAGAEKVGRHKTSMLQDVERLEGMAQRAGARLVFRPGSRRVLQVDRARIDRAALLAMERGQALAWITARLTSGEDFPIGKDLTLGLGDRTDIALDSAWGRIVARLEADTACDAREGDKTAFTFDAAHAHYFEPGECGARIHG